MVKNSNMETQDPNVDTAVVMSDGTVAYLSASGRYFVRREPEKYNWNTIRYYDTKTLEEIPLTTAVCRHCQERITSKHCGHFVRCSCGKTFVDTDRWMPEHGRVGGEPV